MDLPGRRKRERSQRRFTDVMKDDMQRVGVTEENARDSEMETEDSLC